MRKASLIVGIGCMALAACDRGSEAPVEPTASADRPTTETSRSAAPIALPEALAAIEDQAHALEAIEGEVQQGDVTIKYRAYADDSGQLIYVDEDVMAGDYGASRDRYYFVDGRLAYFYREGSQLVAMPPEPPGLGDVVLYLAFKQDGTIDTMEKRAKGRQVRLERFEVTGVARRADQLRRIAAVAVAEPLGENEYAGYVVFKDPLSTFQPCGDTTIYWLTGDDDVVAALRDAYAAVLGDAAGEAAYARLVGSVEDPVREGPASHYPAVFNVRAQTALARRADRDCP